MIQQYGDNNTGLLLFDNDEFPDIITYGDDENPYLSSPNAVEDCFFYMTRDNSRDIETYRKFIQNAITQFRHTRTYTNYKSFLISIGLDRCQKLGTITNEMATVEMHHNILTIFEIGLLISEHVLNTTGKITTFDLIHLLKDEHKNNHIPIVMLSKTAHQMYHDDKENYVPIDMTFGQWWLLLYNYRYGITLDIAYKINEYIERSFNETDPNINGYVLQLRDQLLQIGGYNEYGYNYANCGYLADPNTNIRENLLY